MGRPGCRSLFGAMFFSENSSTSWTMKTRKARELREVVPSSELHTTHLGDCSEDGTKRFVILTPREKSVIVIVQLELKKITS